jgi:hypothetical protein
MVHGGCRRLVFLRDDLLATGSLWGGGLRIWRRSPEGDWGEAAGFPEPASVHQLVVAPGPKLLAAGAHEVFVWEPGEPSLPPREQLSVHGEGRTNQVNDLALSPGDPNRLAVATLSRLELYDLGTRQRLWAIPPDPADPRLFPPEARPVVAFGPRGKKILVGWGETSEGGIKSKLRCRLLLVDVEDQGKLEAPLRARPNALAAGRDGRWWVALNDGQIQERGPDLRVLQRLDCGPIDPKEKGTTVQAWMRAAHPGPVFGLVRGAGLLVSLSSHRNEAAEHVHVWREDGTPLRCLPHPRSGQTTLFTLVLSPGGAHIAFAAEDSLPGGRREKAHIEVWELPRQ